jgi:CBS domain-containing protein
VTEDDGTVSGVVTPREVRGIARAKWQQTRAGDVMVAVTEVPVTTPGVDIARALIRMEGDDLFQLPVIDDGRLVGVIDRVHVLQLIQKLRTQRA